MRKEEERKDYEEIVGKMMKYWGKRDGSRGGDTREEERLEKEWNREGGKKINAGKKK